VEADTPAEASAAAVFLSYASQDAAAAERIATALREAGIEVWFDRNALRGGDAWDRHIRRQIKDCALFVPVISANSQARSEGYFRLEWTLADQRTQLMGKNRTFILPVCVDGTGERNADVPDSFLSVQWTRLPAGETSPAFVARVRGLLAPASPALTNTAVPAPGGATFVALKPKRTRPAWIIPAALVALALGVAAWFYMQRSHTTGPQTTSFSPPPHSIAVLPFANLSGDKDQQYFSDGLTEELLNSLSQINALQVAARTSAFSFGEHPDVATVAHRLNVGTVLEGSVRRSEHTVRITVQLINAVTGFNLWSQSYDRDLGDVLKLQTDIATAVAQALKVRLLGDVAAKIELGNTRNAAALDAYLRARTASMLRNDPAADLTAAINLYGEAIRLDPDYALAFAGRSAAYTVFAAEDASGAAVRENFALAESDARHAVALAPQLADAHMALAFVLENASLDFYHAAQEYDQAVSLAPGNATVIGLSGRFAGFMGRSQIAIAQTRRAVVLDPLARASYSNLGRALYDARQFGESASAYSRALTLNPQYAAGYADRGLVLFALGDLPGARVSCEAQRTHWFGQECLALVYERLGRHSEAVAELTKIRTQLGETAAYQISTIYAQWGDRAQGLDWLETALRLRDPGLVELKTDPLMDPLRQEPRFKTVLAALKFPE
jgi:TolB-like protein/Tfp pilus assembly protein PilF